MGFLATGNRRFVSTFAVSMYTVTCTQSQKRYVHAMYAMYTATALYSAGV